MKNSQSAECASEQAKLKTIKKILCHPDNKTCADCSANEPTWASLKFGVWVCLNCSGYHRCIGATYTRIQSAYLDHWSLQSLEIFSSLTNVISNHYWEATLNPQVDKKPSPDHKPKEGLAFVKKKYLEMKFVAPNCKNPTVHYLEFKHLAKHDDYESYQKKKMNLDIDSGNFMRTDKRMIAATSTSFFDGMKIRCKKGITDCNTVNLYEEDGQLREMSKCRAQHRNIVTYYNGTDSPSLRREVPPEMNFNELVNTASKFTPEKERRSETFTPKVKRISTTRFYNRSISRDMCSLSATKKSSETPGKMSRSSYEPLSTQHTNSRSSFEHKEVLHCHPKQQIRTEFEIEGLHKKKSALWKKYYHNYHGEFILLGGFLVHLALGSYCAWEAVAPYILSYLKFHNQAIDYHTCYNRLRMLQIISFSVGLSIGVKLGKLFGYRKVLCLVSILGCGSIFASSLMTQLFPFALLYAILPGICCGIMYMLPICCAWETLCKKDAIVTGIINSAFAISAVVPFGLSYWIMSLSSFTSLIEAAALLKTIDSDPEINFKAPLLLKIFAILLLILLLLGTALISPKMTAEDLKRHLLDDEALTRPSENFHRRSECNDIKSGLKSSSFRSLFVIMLLTSIFGFYASINYNLFGERSGVNRKSLIYIWIASIVINGLSRIFWTKLFERFSFTVTCNTMLIMQGCFIVGLRLAGIFNLCYPIAIIGISFCLGFSFSVFPLVAKKLFGSQRCAELYGLLFWVYTIVILLIGLIDSVLFPLLGEQLMLVMFLILTTIACYLCSGIDQNPQWGLQEMWIELKTKRSYITDEKYII